MTLLLEFNWLCLTNSRPIVPWLMLLTAGACGRWIQLLRSHHPGRAFGVLVFELRVDLLGQVRLALRLVELCKLQLGQAGWHCSGRLGGEFVVEIDGLRIAGCLTIELRECEFCQCRAYA